jgi:hypothetical protein
MSIKEVPFGIVFVAVLMILFGLAEVVTGFRRHFFGISTSQSAIFLVAAAAIGAFLFRSWFTHPNPEEVGCTARYRVRRG